jgi:glutathione synthase/RimK-type ligase-like ATP-grasp enzyme
MTAIFLRRRKLGAGSCHGIRRNSEHQIVVARNDVRNRRGYQEGHQWLVRWGCTDTVPERFNVIQSAASIQRVNDKLGFRRQLINEGVELAPNTWFNFNDEGVTYPCIVRPNVHAQGRRLHVCNNLQELRVACNRYPLYYISELINKAAEYRVFCVQGRVAAVAEKTPGDRNAVAWNVSQGGRFDHVRWDDWPLQAVRKSVEAFNLSGLDFGGVDVMVDQAGRSYIIEINSAPSLPLKEDGDPTHRQLCMAKCFDYIFTNNSKASIPVREGRGGYRKFIHPAISDNAELVGG